MDAKGIEAVETIPASKKLGKKDASLSAKAAGKVFVAKGKKISEFKGGTGSAEIVSAMLGPTGNLRAPTIRKGKTVVVGYNDDRCEQRCGELRGWARSLHSPSIGMRDSSPSSRLSSPSMRTRVFAELAFPRRSRTPASSKQERS